MARMVKNWKIGMPFTGIRQPFFGYNHSLPTAVAANAKRRAIGFDGMEDYPFMKCSGDHFSYKTATNKAVEGEGHTGQKSLRITSGSKSTVYKNLLGMVDVNKKNNL